MLRVPPPRGARHARPADEPPEARGGAPADGGAARRRRRWEVAGHRSRGTLPRGAGLRGTRRPAGGWEACPPTSHARRAGAHLPTAARHRAGPGRRPAIGRGTPWSRRPGLRLTLPRAAGHPAPRGRAAGTPPPRPGPPLRGPARHHAGPGRRAVPIAGDPWLRGPRAAAHPTPRTPGCGASRPEATPAPRPPAPQDSPGARPGHPCQLRHRAAYAPSAATSSSWLPSSLMRPFSTTAMTSASWAVCRRWAMATTVRPSRTRARERSR